MDLDRLGEIEVGTFLGVVESIILDISVLCLNGSFVIQGPVAKQCNVCFALNCIE